MTMLIKREILFELSYNRIEDFIDMFNKKILAGLEDQFGMSPAIYNEAREYMDDYFDTKNYQLKTPPKKETSAHLLEEKFFDVYGVDEDTDCWRIYCKLFSESGEEEISANFDLIHDRENFKLIYLYTAS